MNNYYKKYIKYKKKYILYKNHIGGLKLNSNFKKWLETQITFANENKLSNPISDEIALLYTQAMNAFNNILRKIPTKTDDELKRSKLSVVGTFLTKHPDMTMLKAIDILKEIILRSPSIKKSFNVYRGVDKKYANYKINDTFTEFGFMSTTYNISHAAYYVISDFDEEKIKEKIKEKNICCVFEITLPVNSHAFYISYRYAGGPLDEYEIVLLPNTTLIVRDIKNIDINYPPLMERDGFINMKIIKVDII